MRSLLLSLKNNNFASPSACDAIQMNVSDDEFNARQGDEIEYAATFLCCVCLLCFDIHRQQLDSFFLQHKSIISLLLKEVSTVLVI